MFDINSLGFGREIYSADHEAFREVVRRFFRKEIEPNVKEWEKAGFYDREIFRTAGKLGILCAFIPTRYGGGGGDALHQMVLFEEHGYSPAGVSLETGMCTDISAYCVYDSGTEEQKLEWLPQIAAGEAVVEIAVSEPGAGSDVQGIKTYARKDGNDYILNGQKMWISNGPILDVAFVVARTRQDDDRDTYSMFIVPTATKGVTCTKPMDLTMKGCGGVGEIYFDDVRIPAANLLGGVEGRGLHAALSMIDAGRVGTAARGVATAELAVVLTLEYVKSRQVFGKSVFDFQNTQFKLAQCAADIAAARALSDRTAQRFAKGTMAPHEAAQTKLVGAETSFRVIDDCLQLYGGMGYSNDMPISKMFNLIRSYRTQGGTSEIMRSVIARAMN